ncbi:YbaY family lipoprotein [Pseudomonas vancouverensis]|uniref:Uncharacterized protein n=1 Tax=Pseudomonas vancouverensis TaxID=95300 RepID=A0A1H2M6X5_PSEVA|nr:YbaY family lipoprotein [Pseudomonas vancouverensis]KAB0498867.1 hypothetical protein F7R09_06035 [Pseudomonas vancouverensis]TDB57564.1 hypothetical protein EIY72_25205 [Pseudomonas vancouverensis]SDU88919.1 putative lipoprotein [Pseudomonas vancouverensis]
MGNDSVKTIAGNVHYLEKIALPSGSTLRVYLQDVSRMDVPVKELAVQVTPNAEQAGLAFHLTYNTADVVDGHTYALSASITHNCKLIFTNTDHHPVQLGVDHVTGQDIRVHRV